MEKENTIKYGLNKNKDVFYVRFPKRYFDESEFDPYSLKYDEEQEIWFDKTYNKPGWFSFLFALGNHVPQEYVDKIKSKLDEGKKYVYTITDKGVYVKTGYLNLVEILLELGFSSCKENMLYFAPMKDAIKNADKIKEIFDSELGSKLQETARVKSELDRINKQIVSNNLRGQFPKYLYEFQKDFVEIALTKFLSGETGIMLADAVGLGKTVQSLGVAEMLFRLNKIDKVLIITKKNVVNQFATEVKRFLNIDPVILSTVSWHPERGKVLVCNYEPIKKFVNNWNLLPPGSENRILFIIDEITTLKSPKSAIRKAFDLLLKTYPGFRIGMTATPFGKELEETYNIFKIVAPDFMTWRQFNIRHRNTTRITKTFKNKRGEYYTRDIEIVLNYKNFGEFHKAIEPHMVRRDKTVANKELGEKIVKNIVLLPNKKFLELYLRFLNDIEIAIQKIYEPPEQHIGQLMGLSLLRQFCNYVGLFEESESMLLQHIPYKEYILESPTPKLKWTIEKVKEINDRVIIFSEFSRMVRVLDAALKEQGFKTKTITGSTDRDDREKLRLDFQKGKFDVLIGTNAIAYGGNFQFVNHLINYDIAYNPEINYQREGRIHRLGNKDTKYIYNLILSSGSPEVQTIEELLIQKVMRRMSEAEITIDGIPDNSGDTILSELSRQIFH